jgi:hypothetical protein
MYTQQKKGSSKKKIEIRPTMNLYRFQKTSKPNLKGALKYTNKMSNPKKLITDH